MPQLNQVQMRYVPAEDRILLRINTTDRCEYRFWITRRFARLLWPVLSRLTQADPQVMVAADPAARQAILAFQQEQAVQQANFGAAFRDSVDQLPLGETPVLLGRLQVRPATENRHVISLQPMEGQGIELSMGRDLLHALMKLLAETAAKAEWSLGFAAHAGESAPPRRAAVN
jgi:hypothetical protein